MNDVRLMALAARPIAAPAPAQMQPASAAGQGFGDKLAAALGDANRELIAGERAASEFASGEIDTLDAMVALSKADLTLRHLVTLRNRALESLQEVLRLPL